MVPVTDLLSEPVLDGGAGRLWINIEGEARLSEMQLLQLANQMTR